MSIFEVNEKGSLPVWLQLKNRLIYLITSGYYKPGDQLPTVRGLAIEAEVNYNTISKVYMSLEQEGYIETRQRHGAFVCDISKRGGDYSKVTNAANHMAHDFIRRCLEFGMSYEDIEQHFLLAMNEVRTSDGESKNESTEKEL